MRSPLLAWTLAIAGAVALCASATAAPQTPPQAGNAQAPVGHRQPTPETVQAGGTDQQGDILSKLQQEDRELDRKLSNICRGC